MPIEQLYQIYLQYPSVKTDTRQLMPGDIFFALKGPSFNGNHYAKQAIESGAACCVVDESLDFEDDKLFRVDDVLTALQQLARFHREQFNIPFLAITGSNGKTTTKELIHAVLSEQFITYTTTGNLNNHIGIPLTLLKIKKDAQMAVIEMGANHQLEIAGYCSYVQPTHGLITNCGMAHLEGFGGQAGIRKGKGELFDYLRAHDGTAFVLDDHDYFKEMSVGLKEIITYGTKSTANTIGHIYNDERLMQVSLLNDGIEEIISTQLVGGYNLPNVLAAVCVGRYFGVGETAIKKALESYTPANSRSQLLEVNGNTIIMDAYNANPISMKLAIENFAAMAGERKVLMLGAMMELGDVSAAEHQNLIELISKFPWEAVVLVGKPFEHTHHPYIYFPQSSEAAVWFKEHHFSNIQLLIKGSRSMKMEKVLE